MTLIRSSRAARKGGQLTPTVIRITGVTVLVFIVVATVDLGRLQSALMGNADVHQNVASHWQNRDPATIVCQLSGGMGNNIEIYAHCRVISLLLRRDYRVPSRIVIRHEDSTTWRSVERDLKSCFPIFRSMDFEEGNSRGFHRRQKQQLELLGGNLTTLLNTLFVSWRGHRFLDPYEVDSALGTFVNASAAAARNVSDESSPYRNATDSVNISLPFLHVSWLASVDTYMDEMMQDFRNVLAFDTVNASSGCCALLPDKDETVFHLRNYLVELPHDTHAFGYDELGPEQAARDLVGHLSPGDKVAILSRYSQESAQRYIDAMERRGLRVRYISGQTGLQDFCFLMHAKKEMIGIAISTFFWWAAYLSDCSKVTAYSVDTDIRRSRFGDKYLRYNFTNPLLAERIFRPLIALDPSIERSGG